MSKFSVAAYKNAINILLIVCLHQIVAILNTTYYQIIILNKAVLFVGYTHSSVISLTFIRLLFIDEWQLVSITRQCLNKIISRICFMLNRFGKICSASDFT